MKNIKHILLAAVLLLAIFQKMAAQSSPNCSTFSDNDYLTGQSFFNHGSVSNAFNSKYRSNQTIGQPVIGTQLGQLKKTTYGFWGRFLLPPAAPIVTCSEGDLEDRVQIEWAPDPLSPSATSYKLYRNGFLLAAVDGETFSFLDFNVIAGKFYTYEVTGVNTFGEGVRGVALGFLNPNGVVTGQVKSFAGNPVPGTIVTLTPTLGTSGSFAGDDMAFAEYSTAFPRTQFSLSTWVKLGAGNDNAAIFDLGSTISKNWWLHTLPSASGKGVRFGMGNGVGNVTNLDYAFPAATADAWHNIAVTYNGSSVLLYADGELISTAVAAVSADSMPLFFGVKAYQTGYFTGNIDEVRFFDRQMSQTEIQMFLNRTVAPDMDGLVNYWKFDEGTGSKTFDLTPAKQKMYFCGASFSSDKPNVLNAGLTNEDGFYKIPGINYASGTTFTARPSKNFYYNQSLEFNGVNEQFATLTDFDLADSSTVEITVKGFDFAGSQCLLNKGSHFNLNLNAGDLVLTIGGTTQNLGSLGMGFHRLSFVIEQVGGGSSAAVTFYKDGTLVGTNTFSGVASNFAGGGGWLLGKNSGGNYFSGLIDEVAFFNTLLPLQDIQLHANIGTNVVHKSLKNYFPLNEGEGTSIKDYGFALTGKGTTDGATFSTVAGITQEEPHKFTPSTRFVTLDPSNTSVDGIDFTDQSTVPVSGYVRFDGTDCFQEKVEIYINGQRSAPPVYTDSTGYFSLDLEPGESAQLTPVFSNHTFYPPFWEVESVASPIAGILFRNTVKRHIKGQLAGNETCRKSIIPTAPNGDVSAIVKVKVETLDGCFYKDYQFTNPNGKFTFDNLPPLPFTVAVTEHSNNVIYDYFQLRGGATLDLTEKNDTTDFIYNAPPEIEMTPFDTNACGQPMLEQDNDYKLDVRVFQDYDGGRCFLDTAQLHFENLLGDSELDTLMTGGRFKYKFKAQMPNIVAPYLRTLTLEAEAFDQLSSHAQSAVILGKRPRLVNFTTTSPLLPMIILRDPPGDASSATIEKGTTVCEGWGISTSTTATAGVGLEVEMGVETQIILGTPGGGTITQTDVQDTHNFGMSMAMSGTSNQSAEVCLTTTEIISTSDGDVIVGEDADVYVGGALNLLFGITDDLRWDTAECEFSIHPGLLVVPDRFATTFLYSGHQIKTVVIPNLELLGDVASANAWRNILQRNANLKAAAIFEKNLSFDAGVSYESITSIEKSKSYTETFGVEITNSIATELGIELAGIGSSVSLSLDLAFGVEDEFSTSETRTQTVSYALGDDDIGDNFTVDILQDKVYATPVFRTISGNSSCPYEKNTVNRDEVELSVDKTIAVNVPENDAATFKFTLGNISQTSETREYLFSLIPESNPLGAVVKIQGGSPLDRPFQMVYSEGQEVTVTVERNTSLSPHVYENLEFAIFAGCEDEKGIALGLTAIDPKFYKAILLDVTFLEPCSRIDIGFPLQNWVWTIASGDSMFITLNGFNRFDTDLELIRVQYRRKYGDGAWINIAEVPKADLDSDVFKIVKWGTQALQDGEYEIRAVTQCTGGQNAGISHVISGRFERQSPNILGTPEPADGVYSAGDEISITFNEPIRCDLLIQADLFNNNNIGLYNAETDALVDAQLSCSNDQIFLVPRVQNHFLENKTLRVEVNNIKDLAGNVFVETEWEFVNDRNNLNWLDNVPVYVSKYEEEIKTVTRRLQNRGGFNQDFEITGIPNWCLVFPNKGTLVPGAVQEITFQFDSTIVFGKYVDTILVEGALGNEPLEITARVVCHDPGWKVNASDWDYSHNFTLQLDIEGEVSTDLEDIVAAFVGGELRGVSKLKFVNLPGPITKYEAFMTVYSNQFSGETVNFQIWDASVCLKYGSVLESFPFEADGLQGSPQTPTILHTNNMVLREIELHPGWNWISFNLGFANNSLGSVLASVNDPVGDLIKSQTQFAQNDAQFGWLGSLTSILNPPMYQYRTADADTIHQLGVLIDPATVNIPISAGWNWIGFIPQFPLTVNEALASLDPLNGDLIKSQTQFAQFLAGFGWIGNLEYMSPPNGYLLKMAAPGTLTYPNAPVGGKPGVVGGEANNGKVDSRNSIFQVDATKFEHSQTLIAMLENSSANVTGKDFELGAFVGNECRGAAKAIWIEPLQAHLFFQTIYANTTGELLKFKFYDGKDIFDLDETMFFSADAAVGTVQNPFKFSSTISSATDPSGMTNEDFEPFLDVLPNPVSDYATIRFRSPEAENVRFEIADAAGKSIQVFEYQAIKGMNAMLWQEAGNLPQGVYLLKMTAGSLVMTEKVVVR